MKNLNPSNRHIHFCLEKKGNCNVHKARLVDYRTRHDIPLETFFHESFSLSGQDHHTSSRINNLFLLLPSLALLQRWRRKRTLPHDMLVYIPVSRGGVRHIPSLRLDQLFLSQTHIFGNFQEIFSCAFDSRSRAIALAAWGPAPPLTAGRGKSTRSTTPHVRPDHTYINTYPTQLAS